MPTDLTGSPNRGNAGLVDILDRVLDKGLVVAGDIKVSLAEVELLTIRIRLMICSIDKAEEIGLDWWKYDRHLSPGREQLLQENLELREQLQLPLTEVRGDADVLHARAELVADLFVERRRQFLADQHVCISSIASQRLVICGAAPKDAGPFAALRVRRACGRRCASRRSP